MSYAKNCTGTTGCKHKKTMGEIICSGLPCTNKGTHRAHVHIDESSTTSLIMLCPAHNNKSNTKRFYIKKATAVVHLPNCDCCTCGCNRSLSCNIL